ncbi:hypothetical protein [Neomicrococcus lactis]|uniref:Uncharacterized protein n=1 Tax=Neomicrococcus lactis TaxID=732241 RepID=A0A7W8Y9V1_9MICC|nr:hypothetical protein [Neomicrococcus lactis]MBB5597615.1 hypothetical protein [Neomicrococcus lactis]
MSGEEPQPLTRRELRERRLAAEAGKDGAKAAPKSTVSTPEEKAPNAQPVFFAPEDVRPSEPEHNSGPATRRQRRIDAAKAKAAGAPPRADNAEKLDASHVDLSKLKQDGPVTNHFAKIREKSRGDEPKRIVPANDEDGHDSDPKATPTQAEKDLFNTGLNSPDTRSVHVVMPKPSAAQQNFDAEDDPEPSDEFGASKARYETRAQLRQRQAKQNRKDLKASSTAPDRTETATPSPAKPVAVTNTGTPEPFKASGAQGLEPLGFMDGGGARARRQYVLSVSALSLGVLTFIVGLIMMLTR